MFDIVFKNMWQRRTISILTIVANEMCSMVFPTFYGVTVFSSGVGMLAEKGRVVLGAYAASTYFHVNVGDEITYKARGV